MKIIEQHGCLNLNLVKCEKCGKVIAKPKGLVGIEREKKLKEESRKLEKTDSAELLKVRIYSQHSQSLIMLMLSFILTFFISFSVLVYSMFYEKSPLVWGGSFIMIVVFTFGELFLTRRSYKRNLARISNMIEIIKQGKELPELKELNEIEDLERSDDSDKASKN